MRVRSKKEILKMLAYLRLERSGFWNSIGKDRSKQSNEENARYFEESNNMVGLVEWVIGGKDYVR